MVNEIHGNVYKFKQIETAYDSVKNVGSDFNEIAEKIEDFMASEGYYPKLVGQKWKFRYRGN